MGKWSDLTAQQKAAVIKFAMDNGVSDINSIRDTYNLYSIATNNEFAEGGKIHIKPSKRGTFTAAAKKHGKSVQAFASQVLAHKENYSSAMVKKANFARNAAHWHADGNFLTSGGTELNIHLPELTVMPRAAYIKYTGEETVSPTLDEYIKSRQDQAQIEAGHKILQQKAPIVPVIPNQNLISRIAGKFGMSDAERIDRYGIESNPLTCITTASNMYPKGSQVSGVQTFWRNPGNYGFEGTDAPRFGSLYIFPTKSHSAIVTGFNTFGDPVLTYSDGQVGESHMVFDNDNWRHPESERYLGVSSLGIGIPFDFIGTKDQKKAWEKEYKTLYTKSTGGPLYPFSFTGYIPSVRYDEGGLTRDWDNTLTGKLINYVENSDSIGWNPTDRTWEHPTLPGYDKNQIGMGVDKNKTPGYWDSIQIRPKTKTPFLAELDERTIRHNAIEAANTSANARYKYAQTAVNRPKGTISPVKDAAVVSAIYNLGAGNVANGLFEDKAFMLKLFDGTDKEVVDRINQEYKKKNRNERIAKTNAFLFTK